jgi:anthranilate phosphoribosyltransferase
VNAEDGLDEISIGAATHIVELKNNQIIEYVITPEQFGFARADLANLKVKNIEQSLEIIQQVLQNTPGPARDIVALNAGAAIYIAGLAENLAQGIEKASYVLQSGAAYKKFMALKEIELC